MKNEKETRTYFPAYFIKLNKFEEEYPISDAKIIYRGWSFPGENQWKCSSRNDKYHRNTDRSCKEAEDDIEFRCLSSGLPLPVFRAGLKR